MSEKRFDMAIIGGGPAGYTAALYGARSGFSVVVLEKLGAGGQMATTDEVDNYPGFDEGIDGFTLGEKMQKGAERFGAITQYAQVNHVDFSGSTKRLDTSEGVIEARTVVLATGAVPRELGLPEEMALRGKGVAYCATCDGMLYKNKTVVVVGGGYSAVEEALYLSKLCKKVYLVHRREELRAAPLYMELLKEHGIELKLNMQIKQILHEERVTGVLLWDMIHKQEEILPCEGVFVAIGRVPDTKLFAGKVRMDEAGYLVADETTRTNIPGVFAVGDARTKPLRQIVTATADGAVAAHFASEYLLERSTSHKGASVR